MERHYTFIAYKPDSVDSCRGCIMAEYSSNLIVKTYLSEDELIKEWAQVAAFKGGFNERGYDTDVLLHDPELGTYSISACNAEMGNKRTSSEEDDLQYEAFDKLSSEIWKKVEEQAAQIKKNREDKESADKIKEDKKREKEKQAEEMRQLNYLKNKYK